MVGAGGKNRWRAKVPLGVVRRRMAVAGRHGTPKWRLPLLILGIGAVAGLFIAFAGHPVVQWIVLGGLALLGLGIQYFPAYLELAERHREEHDQKFRQARFYRWQKAARKRKEKGS